MRLCDHAMFTSRACPAINAQLTADVSILYSTLVILTWERDMQFKQEDGSENLTRKPDDQHARVSEFIIKKNVFPGI